MIVIPRKWPKAALLLLVVVVLALAPAACGGDDEEATPSTDTQAETQAETTESEPEEVPPPTAEEPTDTEPAPPTSPEDLEGGAGDEEAARSLALFTAEAGRITPRVIRVPAFISIRIELRSEDGRAYGLTFRGAKIRVSGQLSSVSTTIDGLRPGDRLVGTPSGASGQVRIEATAEPGP